MTIELAFPNPDNEPADVVEGLREIELTGFTFHAPPPDSALTNRNRFLVSAFLDYMADAIETEIIGGVDEVWRWSNKVFPPIVKHHPNHWWRKMGKACGELAHVVRTEADPRCSTPADEVALVAALREIHSAYPQHLHEWRDVLAAMPEHAMDGRLALIPAEMVHELDDGLFVQRVFDISYDDSMFPDDTMTAAGLFEFRPSAWFNDFLG